MEQTLRDRINNNFRNQSDVNRELFTYLGKVREMDADDITSDGVDMSDYDKEVYNAEESRIPGNYYSSKLVTRIPHIDSGKQAYRSVVEDNRVNMTPGDGQRKRASFSDTMRNVGRTRLSDIDDFRRRVFKNPIIESAVLGGAAGLGAYFLAPTAQKWLGGAPKYVNPDTGEYEYMTPTERNAWAIGTGLGVAGLGLSRGFNFADPSKSNITTFAKKASMLGPVDYVPKNFAVDAVAANHSLPAGLRYATTNALNYIPGNPMINSTNMVTAGIKSGMSGITGMPVGRIAAAATVDALHAYSAGNMLGVHDPKRLATTVGIGSGIIRGLGSIL